LIQNKFYTHLPGRLKSMRFLLRSIPLAMTVFGAILVPVIAV
jgi:hypothetical protein